MRWRGNDRCAREIIKGRICRESERECSEKVECGMRGGDLYTSKQRLPLAIRADKHFGALEPCVEAALITSKDSPRKFPVCMSR